MKKFLSIIIALTICFSLIGSASALDNSANQAPGTSGSTTYINDPEALDQYVLDNGIEIPEGKTIKSVKITVLNDPALLKKASDIPFQTQSPLSAAALTLSNRVYAGNFYYNDQPFLSDSIEGPMATGPNLKFEHKTTAGFSGELGVEASVITASFGVNFSEEITVTRTYQFDPIPAGDWLIYSAYVNYAVYRFDVYSGSTYLGTSSYWTPVGIVITQEIIG